MSKPKQGFMEELDQWSDETIIQPLSGVYFSGPDDAIMKVEEDAREAIRAKVLESYRNGQAAGPRTQQQRRPYAKR